MIWSHRESKLSQAALLQSLTLTRQRKWNAPPVQKLKAQRFCKGGHNSTLSGQPVLDHEGELLLDAHEITA